MSHYGELWKVFIEGEKRFAKYRDDAWEFAGIFVDGLIEYLGCNPHDIRLVLLGDEHNSEKTYTIPGALQYDQDAYWSMGISLTIRNPEPDRPGMIDLAPQAGFLIKFSIRKENERFQLRMPDGKHFEFDPTKSEDRVAYYQRLVGNMQNILSADLGLRTARSGPVRRIGF